MWIVFLNTLFNKCHSLISSMYVPLTAQSWTFDQTSAWHTVLWRKADSRCTDRAEELKTAAWVSLSVILDYIHTPMQTPHTPLPLSFLASDSRHPVMTWGVSLAASKAALNRQKYLLWQTDRPSPTTTCMQLSLSLQLLLPALWLDFLLFNSLSPLQTSISLFVPFLQLSYAMLKSYT